MVSLFNAAMWLAGAALFSAGWTTRARMSPPPARPRRRRPASV